MATDADNSAAKDPDQWLTGDEPTIAHEAGEDPPGGDLTKAEASKQIDDLQERTGRGQ